jgi:two-component system response regulator CpxR
MRGVLIVDDEYGLAEMVRDLLSIAGFEVATAINGQVALDALEHSHPDVILLDVMMPIMSGIEVIKHVKADEALRDIPVIMMSAAGRDAVDADVKPLMAGFLQKPFTFRELLSAMRTVVPPEETSSAV